MMRRRRNTRGFTLVEVLLVIAILGVLAGVFAFTIGGRSDKAKADLAKVQIEDISAKLDEYRMNVGEYPTEDQGIQALIEKPAFDEEEKEKLWAGPYIKRKQLKDPWGTELGYRPVEAGDGTPASFQLWSFGPDKNDDTGEGDDIKSWEDEEGNG